MSTGVRGTLGIARPLAPLLCRVSRTADLAYTSAEGNKPVIWQRQDFSVGGFLWDASVPTRLTAPVGGIYEVTGYNLWALTTGASFYITALRKNGATFLCVQSVNGAQTTTNLGQVVAAVVELAAGEYIELTISTSVNMSSLFVLGAPSLSMMRVA